MGIHGRDYRKNVPEEKRRKPFDIGKTHKKVEREERKKTKAGSYQDKKNVYDELNKAMVEHDVPEVDKDIFDD